MSMGFNQNNAALLEQQLLRIAKIENIIRHMVSPYGTKYIIDGSLEGIRGISGRIRTIWIIEAGGESPRFVTAYPLY